MKKIITAILLLAITSHSFGAKIRVNNTPGVNANYSSLATAITAAASGDTIYLEPSVIDYGTHTLNKKLVIIGNGVFENSSVPTMGTMNPGLQANMQSTSMTNCTLAQGADSCTITGLDISTLTIAASNVNILRNRINTLNFSNYLVNSATYGSLINITIAQNIFRYSVGTTSVNFTSSTISNVNFFNNIFSRNTLVVSLPTAISGNMAHNLFHISTQYPLNVYNFTIYNNIMPNGAFSPNNNAYYNNMGNSTQFGTTNGNLSNVNMSTVFANYISSYPSDSSMILSATSPAKNSGFGSVDMGPFGGPNPYKLSCIPAFPTIYQLTAPPATTNNILPVTISTRSNN